MPRPRALGGWARVDADVAGVLVELLGLAFHLDAGSFEADILRRNELGIQDALVGDQRVRLELTYAALTGPRAAASAALLRRAIEAEARRMARIPGPLR